MASYYRTRGGQPPATIVTARQELGGFVSASPHPAIALRTMTTTNLGEKASPMYPEKYFFSFYYS
jgi:hypothetical protein